MNNLKVIANNYQLILTTLLVVGVGFIANVYAQGNEDDAIIGTWINEEETTGFEIYETGGEYYAKIAWLKEPNQGGEPKIDKNNPVPAKQTNPLLGTVILEGLTYEEGEWADGTIYNPREGKIFSAYLELEAQDKLAVTGYKGSRWLSKTQYWHRADLPSNGAESQKTN